MDHTVAALNILSVPLARSFCPLSLSLFAGVCIPLTFLFSKALRLKQVKQLVKDQKLLPLEYINCPMPQMLVSGTLQAGACLAISFRTSTEYSQAPGASKPQVHEISSHQLIAMPLLLLRS